ncbi:RdgB/HAM1 family non-canonical purine NTP pyrophosphatase [Mesosutterella sp. OilRF-GAM-744-9]|uniref:dITP/XTP pyrophosphatase n=1 Tax=Mesosutterella porci TaxID=2915351 RepID=A0ABS9MSI7_9BURK|nr:RdgB/HAM1 family non-canonical purine NTP pyrophosphatase [Mesosutterella sp. oilRF-744-WT-GAM-9]MCG5031587.1 RdgB/HAM1 family non-canonical purine NTP pyrophosphatase [Mesosutterella sp. oilRF-744-WT-GAM-9]
MNKIVLASDNPGKIREFNELLAPRGIQVVAQGSLGVSPADEPFGTFLENCLAKARNAARQTGLPALADDSGICVDALDGAPGVHSARFAGEPKSDMRNNELLISRLKGCGNRSAHYVCVLVALKKSDDPDPLVASGCWAGEIVDEPRGSNGFGYDPYFFLKSDGKTAAELSDEEKNARSHRGQAMRMMSALMKERWGW